MSDRAYKERYIHDHKDVNNLPDPSALHPVDILEPVEDANKESDARRLARVLQAIIRIGIDSRQPDAVFAALAFVLKCEHLLPTTNKAELARKHGTSNEAFYWRINSYTKQLDAIYEGRE